MNALDWYHIEGWSPNRRTIRGWTDEQLEKAISDAIERFGDSFYVMLGGVDAYMERRRRRARASIAKATERRDAAWREQEGLDNMWGNS